MKKSLLVCILVFGFIGANAQHRIDIGPYFGSAFYLGDINQGKLFYSPGVSYGAVVRYVFDKRYALRGGLSTAHLSGSDQDFSSFYQNQRNGSFALSLYELSGLVELNYLPYKVGDRKEYYSPYVAAGLAVFYSGNTRFPVQLAVPMGAGLKYNLSTKLSVAFEWTFRKTFTDDLDNLRGNPIDELDGKQLAYFNNKDWYSFAGVILTYKFVLGGIKCLQYAY